MELEDGAYFEGELKDERMHGAGTIFYRSGDVFVGTFANDQKHGVGTYFDRVNQMKIREDYNMGRRTNFVKTPVSEAEMAAQIKNPGYIHSVSYVNRATAN